MLTFDPITEKLLVGTSSADAAATVTRAVNQSKKIYLHCTTGRERSPTVAAAW